jgi:hypothetical protein
MPLLGPSIVGPGAVSVPPPSLPPELLPPELLPPDPGAAELLLLQAAEAAKRVRAHALTTLPDKLIRKAFIVMVPPNSVSLRRRSL